MIFRDKFDHQVCFPTTVTDCELEEGGQSVDLYTEQKCTEVNIKILMVMVILALILILILMLITHF